MTDRAKRIRAKGWAIGLLLATTLLVGAPARATVTIATIPAETDVIPGVATILTGGADMAGMTVRALFDGAPVEMLTWETTGADSGGVFGTDWSLTFSGASTFTGDWVFTNDTGAPLLALTLDGRPGLTLFDICGVDDEFCDTDVPCDNALGNCGTDDSALGLNFFTSAGEDLDIVATYSRQVALTGDPPVGDLWHLLSIDFDTGLADTEWTFEQDTDNDIRITTVPAPATLGLVGGGLLLVGRGRRKAARGRLVGRRG